MEFAVTGRRRLAACGHVRRCRDGPLLFRGGLCDHSAPSTPTGSWVLHLQGLRTFHGLRPSNQDSAPVCPCPRRVILTTRQDSSSYGPITRSPSKTTSSWRFDGRISPCAGHQLRGCLVITPTGLSPASPPKLSGHTLLQNPWPGLLPSPKASGLGPHGPLREFFTTRQRFMFPLRPAGLPPLASTPRISPDAGGLATGLLWRLARVGLTPTG